MKRKPAGSFDRVRVVWSIGILLISIFSGLAVYRLISFLPKERFEEKIIESIKRQGEWFTRNQTNEGDFVYERIVATGEVREGDTSVRQERCTDLHNCMDTPRIQRSNKL